MPLTYLIKSPVISSFSSNLPPRVLQLIPWAVSSKSGTQEILQRMRDEEIDTLLVFDDDGSVVGIVSESEEVALFGKKKKSKRNEKRKEECDKKCEAACANRGGCALVTIGYDKKGNVYCDEFMCGDGTNQTPVFEVSDAEGRS